MNKDKMPASAQVLLRPGTAEPESVREKFAEAGFSVGPLFGNSFSISAPVKQFETVFHLPLEQSAAGGLQFVPAREQPRTDLPTDLLPADLRDHVETIVFSQPPDFGPFNP